MTCLIMTSDCANISTILNFEKICRICLNEGELRSIYFDKEILEILTILTSNQYEENKYFPTQICLKCVDEVERIFNFKKLCIESENTLHNYFKRKLLEENNEFEKVKIEKEDCTDEENDICDDIQNDHDYVDVQIDEEDEDYLSNYIESHLKAESGKRFKNECLKNDLNGVKLDCTLCNISFKHKREFLRHRRNKHPRKRFYSCSICSKLIPGGQAKDHMKNHRMFPCEICKKKFDSAFSLKRHAKTHSGSRPFNCEICEKTYTRLDYLTAHRLVHSGNAITCSFCGKIFSKPARFMLHLRKFHNTVNNTCDICDEDFSSIDILFEHLKVHESVGSLYCKTCGKTFEKIRQFRIHGKKHSDRKGEKRVLDKTYKHVCNICGRAFQTSQALNNHVLVHDEKKFLCSECGKRFSSMNFLKNHMRIHSGLKPYKCPHCDKCFAQKTGLNSHVNVHTGLKPFVCDSCNKSFTQSHHLKRHKLIHTGERPYACSICEKTFSQKENCVVHMRIHTGEKPYQCSICLKGFYDSSTMNKHKKTHNKP